MSSLKSALRAAKTALEARRYPAAVEEAQKALNLDNNNYHARVFLGLALERQDQYDAAESAYAIAAAQKETEALAWQGLVSLYEKQHGEKLDQWHDAALSLAKIYMNEDDRHRCQSTIDQYTLDAKKYGSRSQYKRSLAALLPDSPVYDYLEGRIPQPAITFIKLAEIIEAEERERINAEIGQRRTRLGARIDQVTAEVRRETFESSLLENIYQKIVDWTPDDGVRREYEEKLLKRCGETLALLPPIKKSEKRHRVQELARGLVILRHPFLLAWRIVLEWNDIEDLSNLDIGLLNDFTTLFPDEGLSKVVKGFLQSDASPIPKVDGDSEGNSENEEDSVLMRQEERLILMTDGLEEASSSILAHRMMSQYYIYLDESESAIQVSRQGLQRISSESSICGLSFIHSSDSLKTDLATALVQYQAPRHHPEARSLFNDILKRKPAEVSALIGIGLTYEEQEEFTEASKFLDRALEKADSPKVRAEAAWCRALGGAVNTALPELEACLYLLKGSDVRTKALRAQIFYRIGRCIWDIETSTKTRKDRKGAYSYFLASIQSDLNFAPAYTSLGIYYADFARDKKRAKKCFLKAFELSVSELEAAERLARILAKSGEWDEVEAVATRVVNSGKFRTAPGSKKKSMSWPYSTLGVVELNHQEYAKSIVSFQSALRIDPSDYHSWVGLGESYHHSGRYVAAARAFEHVETVRPTSNQVSDDSWFCKYMLANVKRELGEYEDAISRYEEVLAVKEKETGVSIALLQCLVESASNSIDLGFFGRATGYASKAFQVAQDTVLIQADIFNLWKALGDACSIFVRLPGLAKHCPSQLIQSILTQHGNRGAFEALRQVDGVGEEALDRPQTQVNSGATELTFCVQCAILAHKMAIYLSANDSHVQAVAWYNLGWTENLAHFAKVKIGGGTARSQNTNFLKAAVQCFKKAIELEASNADFWNALGTVTKDLNPKVAQHSFVRSLYLNDRNAGVWTNLGGLYLQQSDLQLANEAFTRAQSTDPDYALAWLGQGLIALKMKDEKEARQLLAHAFEIADASQVLVNQMYALSTFDSFHTGGLLGAIDVLQPLFGLRQLSTQMFEDLPMAHLQALFAERVGDYRDSASGLQHLCDTLEIEYENSEAPEMMLRFVQARADLARMKLADGQFESASENAQTVIDLSPDLQNFVVEYQKLRLSAHMTAGLAAYYLNDMETAVRMFKMLLNETDGDPDIVCLLSQILWAKGGKEEYEISREQLFDCIERYPGHAGATTVLGAIGVLDEDQDILDAVTDDLKSLQVLESLSVQEKAKALALSIDIATLSSTPRSSHASGFSQALSAIALAPSEHIGWGQLMSLSHEEIPTEVAILTTSKAVPPGGNLEAGHLCQAFSGAGKVADMQRAIMIAPWSPQSWEKYP